MRPEWIRGARMVFATASAAALVGLLLAATPVALASTATCDYTASNHKVKIVIHGAGSTNIQKNLRGKITVNGVWCEGKATATNTDQVTILAGDGDQEVDLSWLGGGFQPGATDEPGDSDEIEISISLGGGTDKLFITDLDVAPDNFVAGGSSGPFVVGQINLNAGETNGIDADVTIILGLEKLMINGAGSGDTISGAGGAGTAGEFTVPMELYGNQGPDTLRGGSAADKIYGEAGDDIVKGGPGPDLLYTIDGVSGNDAAFGGTGNDMCQVDPGDQKTSC
jgi:hypothetical protein